MLRDIRLQQRLLRIDDRARRAAFRQIHSEPAIRPPLDKVLGRFLDGYNVALESSTCAEIAARLDAEIELDLRGFAFEGAGMYLALSDALTPWRQNRLAEFMAGVGRAHDYIICIGAGFAAARVPWARYAPVHYASRFAPGLAALVLDGFGFHEGFFHTSKYIDAQRRPFRFDRLPGRCFDTGLGRALWFVRGACPERIRDTIAAFPEERRTDLWAGVGLACAYAGSAYPDLDRYVAVLQRLQIYAGSRVDQLRLGVVFAAETRRKACTPSRWTTRACEAVLGMSFDTAARLGRECWEGASDDLRDRPRVDRLFQVHRVASDRVIHRLGDKLELACSPN